MNSSMKIVKQLHHFNFPIAQSFFFDEIHTRHHKRTKIWDIWIFRLCYLHSVWIKRKMFYENLMVNRQECLFFTFCSTGGMLQGSLEAPRQWMTKRTNKQTDDSHFLLCNYLFTTLSFDFIFLACLLWIPKTIAIANSSANNNLCMHSRFVSLFFHFDVAKKKDWKVVNV